MPRICEFYGIEIYMYHNDHPPPHFHAWYAGEKAEILIETLQVKKGYLPPRVLRLVRNWANQHQEELEQSWNLARQRKTLPMISPWKKGKS